jgi:hypothetical protein
MTRARDLASGLAGVRPFAMASGTVTSANSGLVTVTFPASRFTVTPLVVASVHAGELIAATGSISTSSFTINAFANFYGQVNVRFNGFPIHYQAIQMTSGAASG